MTFILPNDCHWKVRAIHEYWLSIRPPGRLPGRQHFDPLDIPKLLSSIWLFDVFRNPLKFRFRLIGTTLVDFMGRDVTGEWYHDQARGPEGEIARRAIEQTVDSRAPTYRIGPPAMTHEKEFASLERVYFPLAEDGTSVDMILGLCVYYPKATATLEG